MTGLDRRHQPVVLLVVDEQRDALALAHVAQLRPGEVGVQVQDPRAELGGAEGDVEEAAVVAAQDPDAVAVAQTAVAQPARQRVRAASSSANVSVPSSSIRPARSPWRIAAIAIAPPSCPSRSSARKIASARLGRSNPTIPAR